jgi:hypothetical protein
MPDNIQKLKELIKQEAEKLLCETHPSVCQLRDVNYSRLEDLVMTELEGYDYDISVQSALANIETDLGDNDTNEEE